MDPWDLDHPTHSLAASPSAVEGDLPARSETRNLESPRTADPGIADGPSQDFITLYEESLELERTDYHLPNLQTFVEKVSEAYNAKWSTRHIPYQRVVVLLVFWEEDDLGVRTEIRSLEEVFRDSYHFDVETWAIPSAKRGIISLMSKVGSLLDQYDHEGNLFIFYYGGHACQDEQSQPTWISKRDGGTSFNSSAVLQLFQNMNADALMLFDSCQAVPQAFKSTGKGVASAITATGFEPGAVGTAAEVGPHSFTHSIIQVLGMLSTPMWNSGAPVSDVMLHSILISELKKRHVSLETQPDGSFRRDANGHHLVEPFRRRTPIYHWLSANKPHRPIRLSPLNRRQGVYSAAALPSQMPDFDYIAPEVLISVRLTPDTLTEGDVDAWAKWILSLPNGASDVTLKGHAVKVEGFYRSYSSLIVLRMPVETWTCLPRYKAFGFIGYVTSDNQAQEVNDKLAAKIKEISSSKSGDLNTGPDTPLALVNLDSLERSNSCATTLGGGDVRDSGEGQNEIRPGPLRSSNPKDKQRLKSFRHPHRLQATTGASSTLSVSWDPHGSNFWARASHIRPLLYLYLLSTIFCVLYCLFVYSVLLRGSIETPGGVFWDASTTNYVVSILSSLSGIILAATLQALLFTLRSTLAARTNGLSFTSYVALGNTSWMSILQVSVANRFTNLWSSFRLALPLLSLFLASIIKFQAYFDYQFVPSSNIIPVYAGLFPPSDMQLFQASSAWIPTLFNTFSTNLLTNSIYALPFPMDGCDGACRSVVLPGGIEMVRPADLSLNTSLYDFLTYSNTASLVNDAWSNGNTVHIFNATSMVIRYDPPAPDALTFNTTSDCVYAGDSPQSGLQICFRQEGLSMLVGWSVCPESIRDASRCNIGNPQPWRTDRIASGTRMTLSRLYTATSYDRSTQAILHITPLSSPEPLPIPADDYIAIFREAFLPSPLSSPEDLVNIRALVYSVTWIHRTYIKSFPDDRESRDAALQDLLAIPIQFGVTPTVFADYCAGELGDAYELCSSLVKTQISEAQAGDSTTRLIIQPWTGWTVIAFGVAFHLGILTWVVWILFFSKTAYLGAESGVAEVDDIRAAARMRVVSETKDRTNGWTGLLERLGFRRQQKCHGWEQPEQREGSEILSLLDYVVDDKVGTSAGCVTAWTLARDSRNLRIREDSAVRSTERAACHPMALMYGRGGKRRNGRR